MFQRIFIFAAFLIGASFWANATPVASLVPSRISGPAPLSVSFDATGTTSTTAGVNPFIQLDYHFIFGDNTSETWQHSGQDKNTQIGGPLAAHLYKEPGTYNVVLRVGERQSNGEISTDTISITITVLDPNQLYNGSNTIVLSRTSSVSGAPTGARILANISSWPTWESGKRYLLMSGQDFTSLGPIRLSGIQDAQINKLGSNYNPHVRSISIEPDLPSTINWSRRIVIANLEITDDDRSSGGLLIGSTAKYVLFYRNIARYVNLGQATMWYATNGQDNITRTLEWPSFIHLIENEIRQTGTETGVTYGYSGEGSVFLGNHFMSSSTHSIRLWFAYKTFIGHNRLTAGPNVPRHTHHLKIHSEGTMNYSSIVSSALRPASRYIVIADNFVGEPDDNKDWSISLSPQNSDASTEEGLENFIVERNRFDKDYGAEITLGGRNMATRGNYIMNSNTRINVAQRTHLPATGWDGPYFIEINPSQAVAIDGTRPLPPSNISVTIEH